ncbi:hypothetical protein SDRG_09079 [Saprolegnia diclina VS20]|uniref:NOG1 N-terminal helical domain-containing protein n=1 Tax=Saprolegnia diclina (strain VS20) TaxID=1156394 RepID=T0QHF5_SAPDV|nr:hypothetical protein SDRG_09079 [Saprolegnia diclina VS20]EQC33090.1 hypothetical protein SDRG_09079 [Saprolegnia diclina VS20]|eukprot:XP_008613213.1 hypothetical protein SDRG_09079 [Saprolegnia diclina VS20]
MDRRAPRPAIGLAHLGRHLVRSALAGAIKFNHPIGRYGFMCDEVTQLRNRKSDPNFKELSPVDTELADVLVKTGRYDVALTRLKTLRGCLRSIRRLIYR